MFTSTWNPQLTKRLTVFDKIITVKDFRPFVTDRTRSSVWPVEVGVSVIRNEEFIVGDLNKTTRKYNGNDLVHIEDP